LPNTRVKRKWMGFDVGTGSGSIKKLKGRAGEG